jgi:hypothetical protein
MRCLVAKVVGVMEMVVHGGGVSALARHLKLEAAAQNETVPQNEQRWRMKTCAVVFFS